MKTLDEKKESTYFLALQRMPGDYRLIDVTKLPINKLPMPRSLMEIDFFTSMYTKEEIISSIKEANIVDESYKNGTLILQDSENNRTLPVLTKDLLGDFNISDFIKENIKNKQLMNNIAYKLGNLILDENKSIIDNFKSAAKTGDFQTILDIIFTLPYETERKFLIYIIEKYYQPLEKKFERIRDKAA